MSDWSLRIEKVENGFVCSHAEELDDGIIMKSKVIEEQEDELEAMERLLIIVADHFGVHYEKHNSRNLIIKIEDK